MLRRAACSGDAGLLFDMLHGHVSGGRSNFNALSALLKATVLRAQTTPAAKRLPMELQRIQERWNHLRQLADAKHPLLFPISLGIAGSLLGSALLFFLRRAPGSKRNTTSAKLILEPSSPMPTESPFISIKSSELLSGSQAASDLFCQQLRDHGFAVLLPDAAQMSALQELLAASGKQFFALDQEKKGRSKEVNSIGFASNLGYVNVKDVREYIKVPSLFVYLFSSAELHFFFL
jgi:hypothetical protein